MGRGRRLKCANKQSFLLCGILPTLPLESRKYVGKSIYLTQGRQDNQVSRVSRQGYQRVGISFNQLLESRLVFEL